MLTVLVWADQRQLLKCRDTINLWIDNILMVMLLHLELIGAVLQLRRWEKNWPIPLGEI